jgi:hypothetical protein
MQYLSKLAICLFLIFAFTFTAVVKPATAQPIAISDGYDVNNDDPTLYQTARKVAQTAIGVVSATGAATGLSGGAGIMSSLAGAGAVVGGGAIAGIGVLSAGPAAITTMVMDEVLKDDDSLTHQEHEARAVGRTMTNIGVAATTTGVVSAIASGGSVTGLSAAGITSGLAALGTTVGGGMVAGTTIAVAAPAVAAATVGYGSYLVWKHLSKD